MVFLIGATFCYRKEKKFIILIFSIFAFVIGFRDLTVGMDTQNYAYLYSAIGRLSWKEIFNGTATTAYSLDSGWVICTKIFTVFSLNYYAFQFVYSVIYMCLSANFIHKLSSNAFVATVVFMGMGLLYYPTNIQRQALATMILMNGWIFFKEKKTVKSITCFLIAVLFHLSACVFGVVYIVYLLNKRIGILKLMPIIGLIIFLNYRNLLMLFTMILSPYKKYITRNGSLAQAHGWWIVWIIIIAISLYVLYLKGNVSCDYKMYCIWALTYVAFNVIGLRFNLVQRLGLYFIPFTVLLFSEFGRYLKKGIKSLYYTGLVVCFIALYLQNNFTMPDRRYVTYLFNN